MGMLRRATPSDDRHEVDCVVKMMTLVSVIGNALLAAIKVMAGLFGHSHALVSDAVHTLSDVGTSVIAWVGVALGRRDADASHPYGHERFESVASLGLGVLLTLTGLWLGRDGVLTLVTSSRRPLMPNDLTAGVALVSIVIKEAMFRYTERRAKAIASSVFLADAWHHRADALSSIGVFIGIVGTRLGLWWCDSVASVAMALLIVWTAFTIVRDALNALLDASCGPDYEAAVREVALATPGVKAVDALRSRRFADKVYLDLEIAVDRRVSLLEAHDVSETVHDAIERTFADVKHVMVHVNPEPSDEASTRVS